MPRKPRSVVGRGIGTSYFERICWLREELLPPEDRLESVRSLFCPSIAFVLHSDTNSCGKYCAAYSFARKRLLRLKILSQANITGCKPRNRLACTLFYKRVMAKKIHLGLLPLSSGRNNNVGLAGGNLARHISHSLVALRN